jgi:hypothetical protein
MSEEKVIHRGEIAADNLMGDVIRLRVGGENVPEAEKEYIGIFHESYIDDIIAALTAIKQQEG